MTSTPLGIAKELGIMPSGFIQKLSLDDLLNLAVAAYWRRRRVFLAQQAQKTQEVK